MFFYDNEMYLFYTLRPDLKDGWKSHEKNPISKDQEYCRNGGLLRIDNIIYRVAQALVLIIMEKSKFNGNRKYFS